MFYCKPVIDKGIQHNDRRDGAVAPKPRPQVLRVGQIRGLDLPGEVGREGCERRVEGPRRRIIETGVEPRQAEAAYRRNTTNTKKKNL